jgi:hypothetical protein
MAKTPKDSPTKIGDRIIMRGRPGKGVVASMLCRPGWVETIWDDGAENPKICHVNELQKID